MNISFSDLPDVFGEIVLFSRRNNSFCEKIRHFFNN